jgi:hypothetical protein
MAYTPINWAENSGVTAVKLDQMDGQIDTNENDLRTIQGGTASVDGRITNIENGATIVSHASNSDALQNESLEVVVNSSGVVNANGTLIIDLLPSQNHYKYLKSVYSNSVVVNQSYVDSVVSARIIKGDSGRPDFLSIVNKTSSNITVYYKVWVLR